MEVVARLSMILTGFILAMLGVIVFIHGEHYPIGVLISFAGVVSMFAGLPSTESNRRLNESFERNKKQMEFDFDK
jgi:hypothetical protein